MSGPPAEPARELALLTSPQGRELLHRIGSRIASRPAAPRLSLVEELRREFPAELVRAALTQHALREAAAGKFTRAADMLFTRTGLEQASSEAAARHRAPRFAGRGRVADLCCGIGGDLIALAGDQPVVAVDRDRRHVTIAVHNAGVYGVREYVTAHVADVREVDLTGVEATFVDPSRRSDGRRLPAGRSEPPLDWCLALTSRVPAVAVKAAPGLPRAAVPPGWEVEFVADGRDLKEAVLWSPAMAAQPRRATILPAGHTLVPRPGDPVPVADPGEYLLDPNPAVTRAGLVEDLARLLGAWKVDQQIAFLSTGSPARTPFARAMRVVESAPWHEKRFARRLRTLDIGVVDVRRRGLAGDVAQIHRRLKLQGHRRATLVITRVRDRPWGLICTDLEPADLEPAMDPPPAG